MNARQQHAFGRLLAAWNRREDARNTGTRQLADAHFALDDARAQMRSTLTSIR